MTNSIPRIGLGRPTSSQTEPEPKPGRLRHGRMRTRGTDATSDRKLAQWLETCVNPLLKRLGWLVLRQPRWALSVAYALILFSGILLTFMWQVDAVLLQMRPPGAHGDGLGFPIALGD